MKPLSPRRYNLKGRNKKPFLIHITDGASNWGCGVGDAIAYCRKEKINLLTLGIGCSPANKQTLKKEYGNLVQFIDRIDELRVYLHHCSDPVSGNKSPYSIKDL